MKIKAKYILKYESRKKHEIEYVKPKCMLKRFSKLANNPRVKTVEVIFVKEGFKNEVIFSNYKNRL